FDTLEPLRRYVRVYGRTTPPAPVTPLLLTIAQHTRAGRERLFWPSMYTPPPWLARFRAMRQRVSAESESNRSAPPPEPPAMFSRIWQRVMVVGPRLNTPAPNPALLAWMMQLV